MPNGLLTVRRASTAELVLGSSKRVRIVEGDNSPSSFSESENEDDAPCALISKKKSLKKANTLRTELTARVEELPSSDEDDGPHKALSGEQFNPQDFVSRYL